MSPGPGHTSVLAAVGRALHLSTPGEVLIEDALGLEIAGDAGAALITQLRATTPAEALDGLALAFALRARFVEDLVAGAAADGVGQYVILGAGLDTFGLRRSDLLGDIRVFEVDQPAAQAWKRGRLADLGITPPFGLDFVPVDLETGSVGTELAQAGFDPEAPALVSWIAVTQYLHREAIDRVLTWAAGLAERSRLVLTYVVPPDELSELARAGLAWTMSQAEARGEPFVSLFRPSEIASALRRAGLPAVHLVDDDRLRDRYLRNWPDAPITGIERLAVAGVPGLIR